MRKFLLLIALIISGVGLINAQEEIVIGNGTSSGYYAPFNNWYKYSWNETIYQKSDIGGAGVINSISYHRATSYSYTTSSIKIYMGETTRSSISSDTDWTPSNQLTLVYSGSNITIGDTEWEKFVLDTPFEYSGENNLVVVVAKTASSYTSSLNWYYTNSSNDSNVSMYRQNDSSTSYAQHPSTYSGTRLTYAANIKLEGEFGDDGENNDPNDCEYVDLNLPSGLKWATCNIGANTPEEYGNTYAWGEIVTKDTYNETNSSTYGVLMNDISGNANYDAATANWGGDWRLPRKEEMEELINQCDWIWTTQNGVRGYKVVSKTNGKHIFLPAAGYIYNTNLSGEGNIGNYWTSTPESYGGNPQGGASGLDYFNDNYVSGSSSVDMYTFGRPGGLKVRPVFGGNFDGTVAQYASVTTNEVSGVSKTTAVCGGNVTSDNGSPVTAKGVCWSTSANPTIEDNKTVDGSGVGAFTSNLSNLSPMTTYYVRAYVTNAAGTRYGVQRSFTTIGDIEIGDTQVINYGNYILKFTVTHAAQCEVICTSMSSKTSITIPSSVTFNGIECSVTSIGNSAFEKCYSYLTNITIPSCVTSIGNSAFKDCSSLTSIVIPTGVTSIGDYTFYSCDDLTSVEMPNTIISIGEKAFYYCDKLTSIDIPYGVTSIGDYAFDHCGGLTNITIPNSVISIGNYAFQDCYNITSLEIPSSVETIGTMAFAYMSRLKDVEISNGVTTIGNSAFHNCSALTSIEIPNSVTTMGNSIFKYCYSLTSAIIHGNITSIGSSTFYNCNKLTSVEMPNTIISIGDSAFYGCSLLTDLEIPSGVTSIGNSAFYGCSALTNMEIPSSVTSIGNSTFYGCSLLTDLEIPSSVTSIGNNAFSSCSSLKNIKCYAETVPSAGSGVFESCHPNMVICVPSVSLEAYQTTEPWKNYNIHSFGSVGDYIEVDYDSYILKYVVTNVEPNECEVVCKTKPTSETSITIPSSVTIDGKEFGVTSIGNSAFNGCYSLTSIEIPDGVTSIGSYTFYNCSSLTSVEIPDGVTSIGTYTFCNCSSLTSVIIPSSVTSIGNSAFYKCSSLTSIVIPTGVTSIGNYAFKDCSTLNKVYSYDITPASLGSLAFYGISSSAKIYVPSVSLNDYKTQCSSYSSKIYAMPTYTEDGWSTQPASSDDVAVVGDLVINNGEILNVNSLGICNDGSVTVKDGGQLICSQANGNITIEKEIEGYANQDGNSWHTIASPLKGETSTGSVTGMITTASYYDLYRYDEPTYTWQNYKNSANNGFTNLESGRGYLYANSEDVTLSFTGNINTDDVSYNLTKEGELLNGFHLIGNPFTHNIKLENNNQIAQGYYTLSNEGAWGVMLDFDEPIKPCQGVLVKALEEGTLTIKNEMPAASRSQQDSKTTRQQMLELHVANGKYSDKAFLVFGKGIGLEKINHQNENIPMVYIPGNDADYAIAIKDRNFKEIPVCFEAGSMGEYTISIAQENCGFDKLYLFDKVTGQTINILENNYSFFATTLDEPNRFVLKTANDEVLENFSYINDNNLIISNVKGNANIEIFDVLGRNVLQCNCNDGEYKIATDRFTAGVYIIRKTDDNGIKTQKVVIE